MADKDSALASLDLTKKDDWEPVPERPEYRGFKREVTITLGRDPVNHPKHYNAHPSGVECITVARHMGFNLGNVMKYIWRAEHKGKALEDLKKAWFYLDDEIARLEKEQDAGRNEQGE